MAYFNHAFSKAFLVDSVAANNTATSDLTAGEFGTVQNSDWTTMADPSAAAPNGLPLGDLMYLVQGSYVINDTIGNNPGHGGYKESVKSKGINPRYISRLYSSSVETATAATVVVSVASDCAPCGENLFLRIDVKGSPALRFLNHNAYAIGDSSGDAAANGASIPSLCCTGAQTHLDPAVALAAATQMLLWDPIIKPFVQEYTAGATTATMFQQGITVTDTAGAQTGILAVSAIPAAGLLYAVGDLVTITQGSAQGAVVEIATIGGGGAVTAVTLVKKGHGYTAAAGLVTVALTGSGNNALTLTITADVNNATYSIAQMLDGTTYTAVTDPVTAGVTASVELVGAYVSTQFGNCSFDTRDHYNKEPVQLIASILDETGNPCNTCGTTTTTPGTMQQTSGETVLRDLLLTEAYMQSPFNQGNKDSPRIQEIEQSNDIVAAVDRTAMYKVYYLQHSIPRFNNPSGVFDNDQYVYKAYVLSTDAAVIVAMDALWTDIQDTCQSALYATQIVFDSNVDNV
jgi:hypothetical protein